MFKLNEELLQFIWRYKLLRPVPLITANGHEIFILDPGELNLDAGPDFFNARIRINGIILAGNIEIHVKTSDWLKHSHHKDKSYDTIILHAVYEHDADLEQNTGNNVEVLELKYLVDERTMNSYKELTGAQAKLPCSSQLKQVDRSKFISWMERMTLERLEEKVKRIEQYFEMYGGDYMQTFYTCLLRNFGFKVNAVPFELLAKQLPLHLLLKHSDSLLQLEALLLGMAGLLEEQSGDMHLRDLQNEFDYLKQKYNLVPLRKELFKFSKLRPANFPNVRLLQFAVLVHTGKALFTNPQSITEYSALSSALKVRPEGYMKDHNGPGIQNVSKLMILGEESVENVIVNTFVPFFFFYGKRLAKPEYREISIRLLSACKAEVNAKTKLFVSRKNELRNAAASQAVINLYDNYCTARKCLRCGIAAAILNPRNH